MVDLVPIEELKQKAITDAFKDGVQGQISLLEYSDIITSRRPDRFKGIWLYSETIADKYDMKPVVLVGGRTAKESESSNEYSAAIATDDTDSQISTMWGVGDRRSSYY